MVMISHSMHLALKRMFEEFGVFVVELGDMIWESLN